MIWELNYSSLLDKIYLRLHENVFEISVKIVYEKIRAFGPEAQATLSSIIGPINTDLGPRIRGFSARQTNQLYGYLVFMPPA